MHRALCLGSLSVHILYPLRSLLPLTLSPSHPRFHLFIIHIHAFSFLLLFLPFFSSCSLTLLHPFFLHFTLRSTRSQFSVSLFHVFPPFPFFYLTPDTVPLLHFFYPFYPFHDNPSSTRPSFFLPFYFPHASSSSFLFSFIHLLLHRQLHIDNKDNFFYTLPGDNNTFHDLLTLSTPPFLTRPTPFHCTQPPDPPLLITFVARLIHQPAYSSHQASFHSFFNI